MKGNANLRKADKFILPNKLMGKKSTGNSGKGSQFFTCSSCFEDNKVIYPYDSAEDSGFRCNCGGKLDRFSEKEYILMFNKQ